jgi:trans-aconitate 2-methyltransferase
MAIVAEAFAPTSRALLSTITGPIRRVLDLGPGPGYSTALLADRFPTAEIVAVEQSEAFAAETRARVPSARVIVANALAPLPGAFDVVYARFLLSHLPDIAGTVDHWCRALAPGGHLVFEEPDAIVSTDPLFARYEAIVAAVVAANGADMYAGAALADTPTPAGFRRAVDHCVVPVITAGTAAAMFWRNARAWAAAADAIVTPAERDGLVVALQARVDDAALDAISWRLRQLVFERVAAPGG